MKQDYMLSEICQNPTFLAGIDWKEFTEWFDEGRIHEIIKTIESDTVCDLVCDYIKTEWYVAANGKIMTNPDKPHQSLIEYTGEFWDGEEVWHYRFEPLEDENSVYLKLPRIEDLVDEALTQRERNKKREARKRELRERGERLMKASLPERKTVEESFIASAPEHKKPKEIITQTGYKTGEDMPESRKGFHIVETLGEAAKFIKMAEIESAKKQYAKEKIIEMLHHFIELGEKYPSNMNAKGEAIREIIDDYFKKNPDSLLDEDWYNRLQKLGRKEIAMKIETINSQKTHIKDSRIGNFYE